MVPGVARYLKKQAIRTPKTKPIPHHNGTGFFIKTRYVIDKKAKNLRLISKLFPQIIWFQVGLRGFVRV